MYCLLSAEVMYCKSLFFYFIGEQSDQKRYIVGVDFHLLMRGVGLVFNTGEAAFWLNPVKNVSSRRLYLDWMREILWPVVDSDRDSMNHALTQGAFSCCGGTHEALLQSIYLIAWHRIHVCLIWGIVYFTRCETPVKALGMCHVLGCHLDSPLPVPFLLSSSEDNPCLGGWCRGSVQCGTQWEISPDGRWFEMVSHSEKFWQPTIILFAVLDVVLQSEGRVTNTQPPLLYTTTSSLNGCSSGHMIFHSSAIIREESQASNWTV